MSEILQSTGPYTGTEESLGNYQVPTWFRNAKFGIFIHWGIYSVPAHNNEWYPRDMYGRWWDVFSKYPLDPRVWWHHKRTYGGSKKTGYKDFIPEFTGAQFDPAHWAACFKRWGAKYVVPVGEHHDGFPMYKTPYTRWNAAEMGPKRDVIRELKAAVQHEGLRFGISSHRAWNWFYYRFNKGDDTMNPANVGLYGTPHKRYAPESDAFLEDWQRRVKEMIDQFEPEILYFDFGWHRPRFNPYRKQVAAYLYNKGVEKGFEPILNYKHQGWVSGNAGFTEGNAVLDIERGASSDIRQHPWQTDTSVSYKSWGYIEGDTFRTGTNLICDLIDIVSKNGNLLINIGPKPDGTFPLEAMAPLDELGAWLEANGEAIYGTRPWHVFGEGPTSRKKNSTKGFNEKPVPYGADDFRFTVRESQADGAWATVYAMQMNPQSKGLSSSIGNTPKQVSLNSFVGRQVAHVETLTGEPVPWRMTEDGLRLELPAVKGANPAHPRVFRIVLG